MAKTKYRNRKVTVDGITFDSLKESQRYIFLREAQERGEIANLTLQPKYELIPKLTEKVIVHLKTKDKVKERCVQLPITYTADFRYEKDGREVVEDVKPSKFMLPKEYVIKVKMMRYYHGITVRAVYKSNEPI